MVHHICSRKATWPIGTFSYTVPCYMHNYNIWKFESVAYDNHSVKYFKCWLLCWLSMKILMLKLNLTFQQGPVLSPLRESPWQSNEETSKSLDGHSFDGVIIYFFLITFSLAEHWRLSWLCQISDTLRIFLTVRWQRCLTPTQQVNLLKRKNPTFPKRLAFVNWMY